MAQAGDYFYTEAGKAFFNLQTPTVPSDLYVAAFTDSVNATGVGTEVADPASNTVNYARLPVGASFFIQALAGIYIASDFLIFNQAVGGGWGTIVSLAFVTVSTGSLTGNVVFFGDLNTAITIDEFDTLRMGNSVSTSVQIL